VKHSGVIIDTPSRLIEKDGLELLEGAIQDFEVNIIIVIGNERLLIDLQRKYSQDSSISIVKLNKSGGVVSRDKTSRRHAQLQRVKEYFYGTVKNDLTPFSQTVPFGDVIVRRAMEGSVAPSSTLPIGMEADPNEIKFVKVENFQGRGYFATLGSCSVIYPSGWVSRCQNPSTRFGGEIGKTKD